jgi:hypothetical protein
MYNEEHKMTTPVTQHQPNNQTQVAFGMPFKPAPMAQGSMFANARLAYSRLKTSPVAKFKTYQDASNVTQAKRIVATGKGTDNLSGELMSFSGPDQTSVKTALARCRGGGCTAPKKKGANL